MDKSPSLGIMDSRISVPVHFIAPFKISRNPLVLRIAFMGVDGIIIWLFLLETNLFTCNWRMFEVKLVRLSLGEFREFIFIFIFLCKLYLVIIFKFEFF